MTLQIIRRDGKIRGIALLMGNGSKVLSGRDERREYWRICDHCTIREAVIFCRSHAKYVCEPCLEWHGRTRIGGDFVLGYACEVISMAVARELAQSAMQRAEVEA